MKKTSTNRPSVADRLRASLLEVHESVTGGQALTARTVVVREPGAWNAEQIKQMRAELNLSQSPFAQLIGVSAELVQHWEQSITTPRGPVRRLLDEIKRDAKGYLKRHVTHK